MLHLLLNDRPWFRPKRRGYGTGLPIAWQGWLMLAAHMVLIIGLALLVTLLVVLAWNASGSRDARRDLRSATSRIYDARTNELLFDNKTAEETQTFEFQSVSTRQLVIEVLVPQGATEKEEHKATDVACVGLLIEHKITDKSGFSSY